MNYKLWTISCGPSHMDHNLCFLVFIAFNYFFRCDLKINDVECKGNRYPVVCVRLRKMTIPPITKIHFTPSVWRGRVSHGSCHAMNHLFHTYKRYMPENAIKHVPGSTNCQESYLRFDHARSHSLATATTKLGENNCIFFPPKVNSICRIPAPASEV